MDYAPTIVERFLRYVKIDTQSDPHSATVPSTDKQKNLSRVLVDELHELGITDAHLDDKGYVYATVPATGNADTPVICFCSHVDTSPETTGTGVNPIVHKSYDGGIITLTNGVRIDPAEHPELQTKIGHDIITADGNTLLGADNKAGVAAIMEAAAYLMRYREVKHGALRLLFTPDEEIGRGANHVDLAKLGARYGYTVDGEALGSFEDETFSADMATVVFSGVNAHPGFAKGKMANALKAASAFIASLPAHRAPEATEGREGFMHPYEIKGGVERAEVVLILRSFDDEELKETGAFVRQKAAEAAATVTGCSAQVTITEQYRNMLNEIAKHPKVTALAIEAIKQAGIEPRLGSIRGGTDGSRLTAMGLPCPNIFAGEHAFHSLQEWCSANDMKKAAETIVHLACLWHEKG